MNVALVLDPSAMIAYARGSDAVGELLLVIAEEHRRIALPAVAVAEAFRQAAEDTHGMLRLLANYGSAMVAALDPRDAEEVGVAARSTSLGVGHAAVVARAANTYLLTADPKAVAGLVDDELIIEI